MAGFGWTEDPVLIELLDEIAFAGDEVSLLGDRKQGGVHKVLCWPAGHGETHCDVQYDMRDEPEEPCFSRADIVWGRRMRDGCTFLVWEYFEDGGIIPRPGTIEDALAIRRFQNGETRVARTEEENRRRAEEYRRKASESTHMLSPQELAKAMDSAITFGRK